MTHTSDHRHLSAGIDVGTSAVKVAVMRSRAGEEGQILATSVQRIRRRNIIDVTRSAFEEARAAAGAAMGEFDYIATTGDADGIEFATGHFYGMTTHARGALFLVPEARSVLDMGALHARAIKMDDRGKVLGHRMTSQCASGSGQFLENIARYLGVALEDVGRLSVQGGKPEEVSGICAVLAETDVINMVSRGISTPDILKGIHLSLANRLIRLLRAIGAEGTVALSGGLALDEGLVNALNEFIAEDGKKTKKAPPKIVPQMHPQSILAGALGAALVGAYRHDQLARLGRLSALKPGGAAALA